MKKLNLNDGVKVKLTPYGAEIYFHQFDELNKVLSAKGVKPVTPHMPRIDEDGLYIIPVMGFHSSLRRIYKHWKTECHN